MSERQCAFLKVEFSSWCIVIELFLKKASFNRQTTNCDMTKPTHLKEEKHDPKQKVAKVRSCLQGGGYLLLQMQHPSGPSLSQILQDDLQQLAPREYTWTIHFHLQDEVLCELAGSRSHLKPHQLTTII